MYKFLFFCLFIFFSKASNAQEKYKDAEKIAKSAIGELQAGNVKSADSLIWLSIQKYPTYTVFEYVRLVAKLPDVLVANRIMDKLIERVSKVDGPDVFIPETSVLLTNKNKLKEIKLEKIEKNRCVFEYCLRAYDENLIVGERKWIEHSLILATGKAIGKKEGFDGYAFSQINLRTELATIQGEYDKAIAIIDEIPESYMPKEFNNGLKIPVYFRSGDYSKTLEFVKGAYGSNEMYKAGLNNWSFILNAIMGNAEEALTNYKNISGPFKESNSIYYYLALIDIRKKQYQLALKNLNIFFRLRGEKNSSGIYDVTMWELFKAFGDAYSGLNEYQKAKDNYNISLLYYPEYEPAIAAVTMLETDYALQSSTDKAAPVISLIDPSPQRGLIINSLESNSTIKGIAADPSGIKEVTINGLKVYSQADGNFWGEISLTDGLNKIVITATDKRGNKSEQVFEIEKKITAIANSEQLEKQGLNYALLLAAQNYSDNKIPSLENPVADAVKLKLILKNNYNFDESNIITLYNPEKNDVKRQLLELTNIIKPEDNLVIFYAGHGLWVEKDKKGYWMLIDSKLDDANTWLPNKDVLDLIAKLPSRHTLLITDACFSGSVFKTRGLDLGKKDETNPSMIQRMNEKISRVAITSGNDTEVPDKSVFMKYLVKALSENKEKYMTAQKMFINQIIEAVMTETKTEPRYGTLELAGHVGGDYIFIRK
ncbi:MAG: caspase family protein [Chitinophagaceae bacterium]|nr:caspase family protein [Chitinophagaceae bacterium]MBP7109052.1 caspase family protein [Chitinophagaceae bacterium]MBP7315694.1 caspase family protein [Chitinophagaceae bacterium]HQX97187.1 caspase family protein [Chitinophagaceae bacterium]HQZ51166.1 caspase family protein [Chitinophagaceae bacterium]